MGDERDEDYVPGPLDPPVEEVQPVIEKPTDLDEDDPSSPPELRQYVVEFVNRVTGDLAGKRVLLGNAYNIMGDLFVAYMTDGKSTMLSGVVRGYSTVDVMPIAAMNSRVQ